MSAAWSDDERRWMVRAIELARSQRPHPNPKVGCVVVDERGEVVGEGVHRGVGTRHAEQEALTQAGAAARGGTAVVSLEPCSHSGRTPPCTQALVAAGVARVVAATHDPDRRVRGKGLELLEAAGVETSVGLLNREAIELDPAYHHHRRTGRPYVRIVSTRGIELLDEAVLSDLADLEGDVDIMVTHAELHTSELAGRAMTDRLVRLGEQGYIYVGVRGEELLPALSREGLVDVATVYSTTPVLETETGWDSGTYRRIGARPVGSFYRIDLAAVSPRPDGPVRRGAEARIPTRHGTFRAIGYEAMDDGRQHVALVRGELGVAPLVRIHSECLTGDAFGSLRCDCGFQLEEALSRIGEEGAGVVLYMRGHEGRGIGLIDKLAAYALQERGRDTVEANLDLGFPEDGRDYGTAAEILKDLGVTGLRLMTNNPAKRAGMEENGLRIVERIPLVTGENDHNRSYLRTKVSKLGHLIDLEEGIPDR